MPVATMSIRELLAAMQRELALDPRALGALEEVPWDASYCVLWVPGTNERSMPAGMHRAFDDLLHGVRIVRVPYRQTWQMRSSVPDGIHVLGDVMRGIAWLRSHGAHIPEQLLMAGHSQGSWVGTQVLASRTLDTSFIRRAIFFANPGANPAHAAGFGTLTRGPVGRVLELSNPDDPITLLPTAIDAALDVVGGPEPWRRVRGIFVSLLLDPVLTLKFAIDQLGQRIVGTGNGEHPFDLGTHLYVSQARDAVRWLRDGSAEALAGVARSTARWNVAPPTVATGPLPGSAATALAALVAR